MYKVKEYRARSLDAVFDDIAAAARAWPEAHRVFLADGDAYNLPTEHLGAICDRLAATFPNLQRITAYATPFNLLAKSVAEIKALKAKKLSLVYVGIESGSDLLLTKIKKGTAAQMEAGLARAAEAGLKVSATVITGLGGQKYWQQHMDETADMLSRVPVTFLSTLQLRLADEVEDRFLDKFAEPFAWQDDHAILLEMRRLVERLTPPSPLIFRSNHASNALPLAGTLPKDRAKVLGQIDLALDRGGGLRPRWMRGL